MLNSVKGNMYSFITHTWNTVKGECPHSCAYCYMKKWGEQKPVRFDEKELKIDLGSGNFIFVGSSCDIFAEAIPAEWIERTLEHCRKFDNRYLFQSKNPYRFLAFEKLLPKNVILGTTIESDIRHKEMGATPGTGTRERAMWVLKERGYKTTITIEPIMNFNINNLVDLITHCRPGWVNIGANTNPKVKLQEPSSEKINELIVRLKEITEVKIKPNLKRLISQ